MNPRLKASKDRLMTAAATALLIAAGLAFASAQTPAPSAAPAPAATATTTGKAGSAPTIAKRFGQDLGKINDDLEKLATELDQVKKRLAEQPAKADPQVKKAEIEAVRKKIVDLGKQIQSDSPLSQRINEFESTLDAQRTRIQNRRDKFDDPEFVERLLKSYKAQLEEISFARGSLGKSTKDVDGLLNELTRSEDRIAELLTLEDFEDATRELKTLVENVNKTILGIRSRLREEFASPTT